MSSDPFADDYERVHVFPEHSKRQLVPKKPWSDEETLGFIFCMMEGGKLSALWRLYGYFSNIYQVTINLGEPQRNWRAVWRRSSQLQKICRKPMTEPMREAN